MSSPCRTERAALGLALLLLAGAAAGCDQKQQTQAHGPAAQGDPYPTVVTTLIPGGGPAPPEDPRGALYQGDAQHIANGKRYFGWYNCAGCHFNGAGGIGPAFLDQKWIYGGSIAEIHNSIAQGRPNGMPTWRGRIPDSQIWEIAAYVRSLSPEAPPPAAPAPDPGQPAPAPAASPSPSNAPAAAS